MSSLLGDSWKVEPSLSVLATCGSAGLLSSPLTADPPGLLLPAPQMPGLQNTVLSSGLQAQDAGRASGRNGRRGICVPFIGNRNPALHQHREQRPHRLREAGSFRGRTSTPWTHTRTRLRWEPHKPGPRPEVEGRGSSLTGRLQELRFESWAGLGPACRAGLLSSRLSFFATPGSGAHMPALNSPSVSPTTLITIPFRQATKTASAALVLIKKSELATLAASVSRSGRQGALTILLPGKKHLPPLLPDRRAHGAPSSPRSECSSISDHLPSDQ